MPGRASRGERPPSSGGEGLEGGPQVTGDLSKASKPGSRVFRRRHYRDRTAKRVSRRARCKRKPGERSTPTVNRDGRRDGKRASREHTVGSSSLSWTLKW